MIDGTVLSSIVVALCGLAGTFVASRAAADKRNLEVNEISARELRAEVKALAAEVKALEAENDDWRVRDHIWREYTTKLRILIERELHDPPEIPPPLKRFP